MRCNEDQTLSLAAKAWNTDLRQRWTCALQKGTPILNRGYYVIQNLGNETAVAICSDANGNPGICGLNVGDFTQQFVMLPLDPDANSANVSYALVNKGNSLALTVDPSSLNLFFTTPDGKNPNQRWSSWLLPIV